MALQLSANIDAEVESAHLSVIDVIQVVFHQGIERRWSTHEIPSDFASTVLDGDYEARIISIGDRRWSLGADDDSMDIVLGNADDVIRDLARYYGLDVFEGARVRHHRLFPGINEVYKDYWVGKGSSMAFEKAVANWTIKFGFSALRQRALRKFERTCSHIFAGGEHTDCPYNPEKGFGVPQVAIVGATTAGTNNNTINDSSALAFRNVAPGHLIFNKTRNCTSRVIRALTDNSLHVTTPVSGVGSGIIGSWQTGDEYALGPKYISCGKSVSDCDARGMFGPNNLHINGLMDGRKYFKGHNDIADVTFRGRTPKGDRFVRRTLGNDSFDGEVLPVIFGNFKIFDLEAIMHANDAERQHGLFVLCEGEIVDVTEPLVNEREPDNADTSDISQARNETATAERYPEAAYASRDSFIKFGTQLIQDDRRCEESYLTPEQAITLARHIRASIGRRMSLGAWFRRTIDAYNWPDPNTGRIEISNPYLFADGTGGGISLHGVSAVRIRIETQSDDDSLLKGDFRIHGLITPLAPTMPGNSEDFGRYDLPKSRSDVENLKYTAYPNHIQAAYAFLINQRWGAGMAPVLIDNDSFIQESSYCEENVSATASSGRARIGGVVDAIPIGVRVADSTNANNFFTLRDQFVYGNNAKEVQNPNIIALSLVGRRITFNAMSHTRQTFSAVIVAAHYFGSNPALDLTADNSLYAHDPNVLDTTNPDNPDNPARENYKSGYYIAIDSSIQPSIGSLYTISGGVHGGLGANKRFKANGVLNDDSTAVEMFESILENCHGIYRVSGGKLQVIIKKELSGSEIDVILSKRLFTDRGEQRNIIHTDSVSTIKVWMKDSEDIVNSYSVEFPDVDRDFKVSRLVVYDDNAQVRAATRLGEHGSRRELSQNIQLNLTTNVDQAKRVLALRLRENVLQSLFCNFQTSLKGGMGVEPGDIIAVDSNAVVGLINSQILPEGIAFGEAFLFRVLEKTETAAYVITLECQLHVNGLYNDSVTDFGNLTAIRSTLDQKAGIAGNVRIFDPIEETYIDQYGFPKSQIRVKVTYPEES